jgi:hypothetical protein
MQFRPSRVVKVTSQGELDSAFASADRLIVEGDDALLSYAATKAAGDGDSEVEVALSHDIMAVAAPSRRGRALSIAAAVMLLVGLLGAGAYFFVPFPEAAAPQVHHHYHSADIGAGRAPASEGHVPAEGPVAVGAEGPSEWAPFLWPAVSVVAILALFLTARQAIAGGRNVEISWRVTEKVSGRMVITKVRTPARRQRAAA